MDHRGVRTEHVRTKVAEHSTSLEETWRQVVEDLLRLSEQPDSGIPTLNGRARGFLKLVKPIALFN